MIKKIKNFSKSSKAFYIAVLFVVILFTATVFYFIYSSNSLLEENDNIVELHFADNITSAHQKTIDHFNKKYEGRIKVIPVNLPFEKFSTNERKEMLARALRSKSDKLDVFAVDYIWARRFAKWALRLDGMLNEDEIGQFIPNALESCFIESKLYAIPLYIDIGLMYFRSDLFEQIIKNKKIESKIFESITWSDLLSLRKKFKNPLYVFPAENYEGLVCSYIELILNQNRDYFTDKYIDLTRKESVKALKLLVDLVNTYEISPKEVVSFDEQRAFQFYLKEKGIFLRGWPGQLDYFYDPNYNEDTTISVKKVPLPHFEGTKPAYIYGGWNLMVSKYSLHQKEALIFLKYLMSKESQLIMFENGNHLPVKKEIYDNERVLEKYRDLKYYHNLFDYGVHRPFLNDYTRVSDIISFYINKAIKKEISINDALKTATKMINDNKVLIR